MTNKSIILILIFSIILATGEKKVCDPVPRPNCALTIKSIEKNTNKPGKYFLFDEEEGKQFFQRDPITEDSEDKYGSDQNGKKPYEMMNSCGERVDVWITRNAHNCDDTKNTLQCGRRSPNRGSQAGDWSYEHSDGSEEKWIAPVTGVSDFCDKVKVCDAIKRPDCALTIEPITENTDVSGKFFKFKEQAAFDFFQAKPRNAYESHTRGYNFINSCGEKVNVWIFRDSEKCDKTDKVLQCGRMSPNDDASVGDWTYLHTDGSTDKWIAPDPEDDSERSFSSYCPKKVVCDAVKRPPCALTITPIVEHTEEPGLFFKFEEQDAMDFFQTNPRHYYSSTQQGGVPYQMINSCGKKVDVWIIRNSKKCDDTGDLLQCGRLHPEDDISAGDWSYKHSDGSQDRWLAPDPEGGRDVLDYCPFVKSCDPVPRPMCSLSINPIVENTEDPGMLFKFDEREGIKFFQAQPRKIDYGSNRQKHKPYKMLNSCGEKVDVWIFRNAKSCDTTDDILQCGRANPLSLAEAGDWNYEHTDGSLERWIMPDPEAKRAPNTFCPAKCNPLPRPKCALTIEPIMTNTDNPGMYFKFDEQDAFKFFQAKPYKMNYSSTFQGNKVYKFYDSCGRRVDVYIFRNSERCDHTKNLLQCGRVTPKAIAHKDDWNYAHTKGSQTKWLAPASNEGAFCRSAHPCDRSNHHDCEHKCLKTTEKGECACNVDYKLNPDQKTCTLVHPCERQNNGGCDHLCEALVEENKYTCKCFDNYELNPDGKTCDIIHPCDREGAAGCSHKCEKKEDDFVCTCPKSFDLMDDEKTCEQVHPCDKENGGCEQLCERDGDKAKCACKPNYKISRKHKEKCVRDFDHFVHPCDIENGGCTHSCERVGKKGVCQCDRNYKMALDGLTCSLIHPCDRGSNGGCSDLCLKQGDRGVCRCQPNFKIGHDEKTCIPIHPCRTEEKGGCDHICVEEGVKAVCKCKSKYKLDTDGKSCVLIHPCDRLDNGGCSHVCEKDGKNAVCSCPEQMELKKNRKTCTLVHPCDRNNGGCDWKCTKHGKRAKCKCMSTQKLSDDGKTCLFIHPCDRGDNGGCEHKCIKLGDRSRCECEPAEDYKLVNERTCVKLHVCDKPSKGGCSHKCIEDGRDGGGHHCTCFKNYALEPDRKTCILTHPCDRPDKGGCHHKCLKDGDQVVCHCKKEYKLATDGMTCLKIHPCDLPDKGGCEYRCMKQGDKALCTCPVNHYLSAKTKRCKKAHPCDERHNGGCEQTCHKIDGKAVCGCVPDFKLQKDKRSCEKVHPCERENNGGCSHTCSADRGLVICKCPKHHKLGMDGKKCRLIHPCGRHDRGGCDQVCIRRGRKAECACRPAHFLNEDKKTCTFIHPCDRSDKGGCQHKCIADRSNSYKCQCDEGYRLAIDGRSCTKRHPCETLNGGCDQMCEMAGEESRCACHIGYEVGIRGHTCYPIHPCDKTNNGGCSQICMKRGAEAKCKCEQGYKLEDDDKTCTKIHPCDLESRGGCTHICNKKGSEVVCSCNENYRLMSDDRTCKRIPPCDRGDNGGCEHKCMSSDEKAVCSCNKNYKLAKNKRSCKLLHPCDRRNNGGCDQICNKTGDTSFCSCRKYYALDLDQMNCVKIHKCDRPDNGGCKHKCTKKGDKAVCEKCDQGYELDENKKCKKVHACDKENKGGCEHECIKDGAKFACACRQDYELEHDGKSCVLVHPCDRGNNGDCDQLCIKKGVDAICGCHEGFQVHKKHPRQCEKMHPCDTPSNGGCDQSCNKRDVWGSMEYTCSCERNWILGEDKRTCTFSHPCSRKEKGGCHQKCVEKGNDYHCECDIDFELMEDDKTCKLRHTCDRDEMGGCSHSCIKLGDDYECHCPADFTLMEGGKNCAKKHPCDTPAKGGCQQMCTKNEDKVVCACANNYTLNKDGKTCSFEHPCDRKGNGGCAQICTKDKTDVVCACHDDYELTGDGKTCAQMHPCDTVDKGGCKHKCNKKGDDFYCSCKDNYVLDVLNHKGCHKSRECDMDSSSECDHNCYLKDGIPRCYCDEDYQLKTDGKSCKKLHVCDRQDNGGCEQICKKDGNMALCKCHEGYTLARDGESCNKVHPCDQESKGGCGHICKKDGDWPVCKCRKNYVLAGDEKTCQLVHPCDRKNNGGCQHICTKDGENAVCSCDDDFKLAEDGKRCTKVHACDTPMNGGCDQKCNKNGDEVECSCSDNYQLDEDSKTCHLIHPCDRKDNGGCDQRCNKDGDNVRCSCNKGYRLASDHLSCQKIHTCDQPENGECSQQCHRDGDDFYCSCDTRYYKLDPFDGECLRLHPCEMAYNGGCSHICIKNKDHFGAKCACPENHELAHDRMTCIRLHPCDRSDKGGCLHDCIKKGDEALCRCDEGYELDDDLVSCRRSTGKKMELARHKCDNPDNGGCEHICNKNDDGSATCSCRENYTLQNDQRTCNIVHMCDRGLNGGCEHVCNRKGANAVCSCNEGYQLRQDGLSCEKIHPCDIDNGGCEQRCMRWGSEFYCSCDLRFFKIDLKDRTKCNKIHRCDYGDNGGCSHECIKKKHNKAKCACPENHKLDEDKKTCRFVHACDRPDKGGCSQICLKDGDLPNCQCYSGFDMAEDGKSCIEKHRCFLPEKGGCEHICNPDGQHWKCSCKPNFKLSLNRKECILIHPCDRPENGGCAQKCNKHKDLAKCSCEDGFKLSADQKSCLKIHPCDTKSKGGCEQQCNKKGDSYYCDCDENHVLNTWDLKSCELMRECSKSGRKNCQHRCNKNLRDDSEQCSCKTNYKLSDNGKTCALLHPCDREDNGGCDQVCTKHGNRAICSCHQGYKLRYDKMRCEKMHPCDLESNGGCSQICVKRGPEAICACHGDEYELEDDKATCTFVHPCDQGNNGGCSQKCHKDGEKAQCVCSMEYDLARDGLACRMKHKCDRPGNGGCQHVCGKEGEKAVCSCYKGFQLNKNKRTCDLVHMCDRVKRGGCDHKCNKDGFEARCSCREGFELGEDGFSCNKIHACDREDNGECAQKCNKKGSSYYCSCDEMFSKLHPDRQSCIKLHKCDMPDNGGCDHLCEKDGEEGNCACFENYKLGEDNKTCELIHLCDRGNNGGCEHICNNIDGMAICTCEVGFVLALDQASCIRGKDAENMQKLVPKVVTPACTKFVGIMHGASMGVGEKPSVGYPGLLPDSPTDIIWVTNHSPYVKFIHTNEKNEVIARALKKGLPMPNSAMEVKAAWSTPKLLKRVKKAEYLIKDITCPGQPQWGMPAEKKTKVLDDSVYEIVTEPEIVPQTQPEIVIPSDSIYEVVPQPKMNGIDETNPVVDEVDDSNEGDIDSLFGIAPSVPSTQTSGCAVYNGKMYGASMGVGDKDALGYAGVIDDAPTDIIWVTNHSPYIKYVRTDSENKVLDRASKKNIPLPQTKEEIKMQWNTEKFLKKVPKAGYLIKDITCGSTPETPQTIQAQTDCAMYTGKMYGSSIKGEDKDVIGFSNILPDSPKHIIWVINLKDEIKYVHTDAENKVINKASKKDGTMPKNAEDMKMAWNKPEFLKKDKDGEYFVKDILCGPGSSSKAPEAEDKIDCALYRGKMYGPSMGVGDKDAIGFTGIIENAPQNIVWVANHKPYIKFVHTDGENKILEKASKKGMEMPKNAEEVKMAWNTPKFLKRVNKAGYFIKDTECEKLPEEIPWVYEIMEAPETKKEAEKKQEKKPTDPEIIYEIVQIEPSDEIPWVYEIPGIQTEPKKEQGKKTECMIYSGKMHGASMGVGDKDATGYVGIIEKSPTDIIWVAIHSPYVKFVHTDKDNKILDKALKKGLPYPENVKEVKAAWETEHLLKKVNKTDYKVKDIKCKTMPKIPVIKPAPAAKQECTVYAGKMFGSSMGVGDKVAIGYPGVVEDSPKDIIWVTNHSPYIKFVHTDAENHVLHKALKKGLPMPQTLEEVKNAWTTPKLLKHVPKAGYLIKDITCGGNAPVPQPVQPQEIIQLPQVKLNPYAMVDPNAESIYEPATIPESNQLPQVKVEPEFKLDPHGMIDPNAEPIYELAPDKPKVCFLNNDWKMEFESYSFTDGICDVKYENNEWMYLDRRVCIGQGQNSEECDSTKHYCSGKGGKTYGYSSIQVKEVITAIRSDHQVSAKCPVETGNCYWHVMENTSIKGLAGAHASKYSVADAKAKCRSTEFGSMCGGITCTGIKECTLRTVDVEPVVSKKPAYTYVYKCSSKPLCPKYSGVMFGESMGVGDHEAVGYTGIIPEAKTDIVWVTNHSPFVKFVHTNSINVVLDQALQKGIPVPKNAEEVKLAWNTDGLLKRVENAGFQVRDIKCGGAKEAEPDASKVCSKYSGIMYGASMGVGEKPAIGYPGLIDGNHKDIIWVANHSPYIKFVHTNGNGEVVEKASKKSISLPSTPEEVKSLWTTPGEVNKVPKAEYLIKSVNCIGVDIAPEKKEVCEVYSAAMFGASMGVGDHPAVGYPGLIEDSPTDLIWVTNHSPYIKFVKTDENLKVLEKALHKGLPMPNTAAAVKDAWTTPHLLKRVPNAGYEIKDMKCGTAKAVCQVYTGKMYGPAMGEEGVHDAIGYPGVIHDGHTDIIWVSNNSPYVKFVHTDSDNVILGKAESKDLSYPTSSGDVKRIWYTPGLLQKVPNAGYFIKDVKCGTTQGAAEVVESQKAEKAAQESERATEPVVKNDATFIKAKNMEKDAAARVNVNEAEAVLVDDSFEGDIDSLFPEKSLGISMKQTNSYFTFILLLIFSLVAFIYGYFYISNRKKETAISNQNIDSNKTDDYLLVNHHITYQNM